MLAAGPNDTIQLEAGYSNETATVTHGGMIITGQASSTGILLQLATGVPTFSLAGAASINVLDASDGNGIVGNGGNNLVTVTGGADSVSGGLGTDRLTVDYRLATGAVTGDSTSSFAEAGGGGRLVTINGGFENFTIQTGSGADTITTGAGDDYISTGHGAGTVNAGQGANTILGGSGADTITALDGGNFIKGGAGDNTLTSGSGKDTIWSGIGADTIVAGAGDDEVTVRGGADTSDAGAGNDRLLVDYSAVSTAVTGGVTGGNMLSGYTGHIGDLAGNIVDFEATENFTISTGSGNDTIITGDGIDTLTGGGGHDRLDAGYGQDALFGGIGDDFLFGRQNNDTLVGDAGADVLFGGLGKDRMDGGDGLDSFVFKSRAESGPSRAARDVIDGFDHGDTIDLSSLDAHTGLAGNQAFSFVQDFTGSAGQLQWDRLSSDSFLVTADVNGDSSADFSLQINGVVADLFASDFIL
jgi:Ca2+-binding RTX toxin-like protein